MSVIPRPLAWGTHAAAALLLLSACGADGTPLGDAAPPRPDVTRYVVGEAAQRLDAGGQFSFAPPAPPASVPIITPERAAQLASAMLHTWGVHHRRSWEKQRGGTLRPERLQPDPRVFYAETPYQLFPATYHPADRRTYGPMYLVQFTQGGEVVLSVGVSAYATDLQIGQGGRVISPRLGGSYFFPVASSLDTTRGPTRYRPISPEEAVERVASATGAKVADVPSLVLREARYHPASAQWRLVLERPVPVLVKKSGARVAVRELYVGPDRAVRMASPQQPAAQRVTFATGPSRRGERQREATASLPRRPEFPLVFDEVSPEP